MLDGHTDRRELAQPAAESVSRGGVMYVFRFTKASRRIDPTQSKGENHQLKNRDSHRDGPVHSSPIQLGFLDHVQALRQACATHLFPTLKKDKTPFADATGKRYARLLKRVGLKDESLVLHGLRHMGITRLSHAGISEKVKMMLAGHAAQGVHGKIYNHRERVPMKLLQEGLERLQYPDVLQALNNSCQTNKTA